MQWSHHRCLFLLVLGGLCFVTGNSPISGCSGDSVKLFANISFNVDNIVITLYKNGKNYTLVGMWSKADSDAVKETLENGYNDRVNIDKHGNLWLHDVSIADEAKYTLIFAIKAWSSTIEVQLVVLVAPSEACIRRIQHVNNTLIAVLDTEDCGSPAASVYWLNHSGLVHENNIAKLTQGKEAGTYYACIKSPALYCARKSEYTDFCKDFTVHEQITLPSLPESTTGASPSYSASPELIATIVSASIISIFMIVVIILLHKKRTQRLRAEDEIVPQRSTEETQISRDEETRQKIAGSGLGKYCFVNEAGNASTGNSEEIQSLRAEDENVLQRSTEGEESPLLSEDDDQSSAPRNLSGEHRSSSCKGIIKLPAVLRPKSAISE